MAPTVEFLVAVQLLRTSDGSGKNGAEQCIGILIVGAEEYERISAAGLQSLAQRFDSPRQQEQGSTGVYPVHGVCADVVTAPAPDVHCKDGSFSEAVL